MHMNLMNWQSDATQKEYNQTLDGILLILWCTHTVHIMNCKNKMKWKIVSLQTFQCMCWQSIRNMNTNKGILNISKHHSWKEKTSIPNVVTGIHTAKPNCVCCVQSIPKYFCTTIAAYCAWAIHVNDSQHFTIRISFDRCTYTCTNINPICTCFAFDNFIVFKSAWCTEVYCNIMIT